MPNTFRLAIRFLWREWRAGEWLVVVIALLCAITATTAIHFYTDRLNRGLSLQSAKFLGGDLVVSSPEPIPETWRQYAAGLQLKTSEVWSYPSVVTAGDKLQLVNLQAVADNYPLIGAGLRPDINTVWVEPRLLPLLGIALSAPIKLGDATFQVTRLLTPDIDLLNTGWAIAPRLMMRLQDVPATKTVVTGSRIDYRLLIVGDTPKLVKFRQWIQPQLTNSQHLLDATTQQATLHKVLQRAQDYMQLVLLGCLLMSGVAIALSIQQYMRRHYSQVALWRCLGGKQTQLRAIIFWQLTVVAVVTGMIAVGLGFLAQSVLATLFKNFLQFPLPAAGVTPVIMGLCSSILLLFAFALPAIWELPRTSPLTIWQNTSGRAYRKNSYLLFAFMVIAIFIYYCMDFSLLTLYFLAILLLGTALLYVISLLWLSLVRRMLFYTGGAVRRGLSQLVQYADSVSLQFVGFNLILIALIVLGCLRNYLITDWRQTLPAGTPNYFAFNIGPTDLDTLKNFFARQQIHVAGIYPMIRGRLIALDTKPIMQSVPVAAQGNNALHRELNLSFMWDYPADNKIVSGNAFRQQDAGKALVSVEAKLANDLNLHLGQQLTFQIGAQQVTATIANFRSLDWTSFHPNFFMIFPPGLLHDYPLTYITSFHLDSSQMSVLNQLVELMPNLTVIDVAALLQQMQELIAKVTLAMQYLFLFALGDGVLIFLTCLQASMDERRQTYRLLRVLGASRQYLQNSLAVEFTSLSIVILFSATSMAFLIVFLLEKYFFNG
jgi:putative ABC transport system permease protein